MRLRLSMSQKEALAFYLLVSPWVVGFLVFQIGPMLASLGFSFAKYDIVRPPVWIGLNNYEEMFFGDPLFWQALKVTGTYTFLAVPLGIVVSLFLAVMLNQRIPALSIFRTIFYLPSVISGVAVSLLWLWMLNPTFGLINYLLRVLFGIQGPKWLLSGPWVIPSFVLMSMWSVGGSLVIYLAALQSVPTELYEAASLDGATAWRRFWHVTLPMISPVILFTFITGIIGSLQTFTQAYVMSDRGRGGPHYASLFYGLYLFQNAFRYFRMGYASALAWVLFLIILLLTSLTFKLSSERVFYAGGR
jgi:multiple sugar transport system permease protein